LRITPRWIAELLEQAAIATYGTLSWMLPGDRRVDAGEALQSPEDALAETS
jgi:hypothetical protein